MLSAIAMFNPGLVFATLVVHFVTARTSPIPALECLDCDDSIIADNLLVNVQAVYPRRNGDGSETCESNGEHCTTTAMAPSNSTSVASPTTGISNSTSPVMTNTSAPASATPTSGSTSSSQTPAQTPVVLSHDRMSISTGGIIGTAFGAFVLVVATLIICAILYRRRRSHNNAQGPSPAVYQGDSPPGFGTLFPPTEMSQTDSSPLVALALASRTTSTPPRSYPMSSSTTGSMSPLIGPASLNHSLSVTSSSNRRTSLSYTDGGSSHERLQHGQEIQVLSPMFGSEHQGSPRTDFSGGLTGIILGSTTPNSPQIEPSDSNLVRAMTAHQKSLEADDRKSAQSGVSTSNDATKQEEQDITENHDPPPRYDA